MVTNNTAASTASNTALPVRDTANAIASGVRSGRPAAAGADLAASFQNILHNSARVDATDLKASMSLTHRPARDPESISEPDHVSRAPDDRRDPRDSEVETADDRDEPNDQSRDTDRTRDPEVAEPAGTAFRANSQPGDGVSAARLADGEAAGKQTAVPDPLFADGGAEPPTAALAANASSPAIVPGEDRDGATDPAGSHARSREAAPPPASPSPRGEAGPGSSAAPEGPDISAKAAAAARQGNDLAKSLPAGEDIKINVTVSKPGDTLFSQPASTLAAATAAEGQKPGSRPGQVPVGASAKAGFVAAGGANQEAPAAQPTQQADSRSGAGDRQSQTGTSGNQAGPAAAPPRSAGPAAPASTAPFADIAGTGSSGGPQAAQRVAAGVRPDPLPTAGRPGLPQPPVSEQVSVQISKAAKAGIDHIDIHLRPKELGRVEVRLELAGDGRVNATVTVDSRETLDLLKTDARGLEKALEDAGLKADSNSLNFNLRGQDGRPSGNPLAQPNHAGSHGDAREAEADGPAPTRTLGDYARGGQSADGHIDIEI